MTTLLSSSATLFDAAYVRPGVAGARVLLLVLLLASPAARAEVLREGPFAGIELSSLPKDDATILRSANEDFVRVDRGDFPRYAQLRAALQDGGTRVYLGRGYTLTRLQSLSSLGELRGYIFGPVLQFDKDFCPGNVGTLAHTRFLSTEEMKRLRK